MPDSTTPEYPAVLPTGDAYHDLKDNGLRWRVAGGMVGGQPEGAILSIKQLQPGAHLQWLIDRGALIPLTEDEAKMYAASAPPVMPLPYMVDGRTEEAKAKSDKPDAKPESSSSPIPPAKPDGRSNR